MTKAELIHGDISFGNVLILPTLVKKAGQYKVEWRGILADWELSKPIPEDGQPHRARQPERTVSAYIKSSFHKCSSLLFQGTWQFMSAALLYFVRLHIAVEDEIESFFYIILYGGVRYLRSSAPDARAFLLAFFDAYQLVNGEYRCGPKKMDSMRGGFINAEFDPVQFIRDDGKDDHPLDIIIADMLPLFKARYAEIGHDRAELLWYKANQQKKTSSASLKPKALIPLKQSVIDTAARLKTHAHFKELLQRMLDEEDWPTDGYVGDLLAAQVVVNDPDDTSGGDQADEDEAGGDESSSEYDTDRDASPSARRVKARRDALAAYDSDGLDEEPQEDADMDVDQPSTSTSRSGRYAASRSSGRGATMRGGTTRRARRA